MHETFRPVVGYERFYIVSDRSVIYRLHRYDKQRKRTLLPRPLKPALDSSTGYLRVSLAGEEGKKSWYLHRVVALAFIPNPLGLPQINHKDGNRANPALTNLEWVTPSENCKDGFKRRPWRQKGENNSASKLTDEAVSDIRSNCVVGDTAGRIEMAEKYGVCEGTIRYALSRGWSHLPLRPRTVKKKQPVKISDEQVRQMRAMYARGKCGRGAPALAKLFGVSDALASQICQGKARTAVL